VDWLSRPPEPAERAPNGRAACVCVCALLPTRREQLRLRKDWPGPGSRLGFQRRDVCRQLARVDIGVNAHRTTADENNRDRRRRTRGASIDDRWRQSCRYSDRHRVGTEVIEPHGPQKQVEVAISHLDLPSTGIPISSECCSFLSSSLTSKQSKLVVFSALFIQIKGLNRCKW
jgi:hypothetical protein